MHTHNIRLIDNTYDLDIAKELLDGFLAKKVSFIEDRIAETDSSNKEEISQLQSRIADLKAESRSLDLFFDEYDGENVEMDIGCTIVMEVKNLEGE